MYGLIEIKNQQTQMGKNLIEDRRQI